MMKKGQELIGYVDHVNFPNKGIVWVEEEDKNKEDGDRNEKDEDGNKKDEDRNTKDNRKDVHPSSSRVKVCVKGVLPGQTVRFRLTKSGSKKEGALLEVLKASGCEGRIPPCPHFGSCGGCT
ncbi:MAG: hypothetical protein K2O03_12585, partial [Lachnospiraceae bacterium]|nr:hypothetical protein [Lachnospiraceae bacterium]